jgi:hypothetical protein
LFVFSPVTMAVIPAAESVTNRDALVVSDNAMCGIRCRNSLRGAPWPWRLAALTVGMPPASARNSTTFLARSAAARAGTRSSRAIRVRAIGYRVGTRDVDFGKGGTRDARPPSADVCGSF